MNPLHRKLQQIRMEKGYTFKHIEEAVGISAKKMYQMEQGKVHLTVEELNALLDYYQVSLADISKRQRFGRAASRKRKRLIWPYISSLIVAAAVTIVWATGAWEPIAKLFAGTDVSSQETVAVSSSPQNSGDPAAEQKEAPLPAADQEAGSEGERLELAGSGEEEPLGLASSDEQEQPPGLASSDEQEQPLQAVEQQAASPGVSLRFWGNVLYQASALPHVTQNNPDAYEIIPVERLGAAAELPSWLTERERERTILNLGTTDIYTDTTFQEQQRLAERGYATLGLGKLPQVYQPYIIEAGGMKVGLLSLTRIIHQPQDAATSRRTGLPSAYDAKLVNQVIQEAKKQTDFLIVLMDWGRTWGTAPETYQRPMAERMINAGADMIVGNHPLVAHQAEMIEGRYVFYSLGHSVSPIKNRTGYNYILDVEIVDRQVVDLRVHGGKLEKDGVLRFELTETDKSKLEQQSKNFFSDPIKLIY